MRALEKFILTMQKRRGKGTEKQREKDERRQPSAVRERLNKSKTQRSSVT